MPDILLAAGIKAVEETNKNICCHRVYILLETDKSLNWQSLDQISPFSTIILVGGGEAVSCGTKHGRLVSKSEQDRLPKRRCGQA